MNSLIEELEEYAPPFVITVEDHTYMVTKIEYDEEKKELKLKCE